MEVRKFTSADASFERSPGQEGDVFAFGRTLEPILVALRDWGERFQARDERATAERS